jgi:hypothetical protein
MKPKTVLYGLNILRLPRPFRTQEDLANATALTSFEGNTPFGQINVGQTLSDSSAYLGRVEHVHHTVGDYGDDKILQMTAVYVTDGD